MESPRPVSTMVARKRSQFWGIPGLTNLPPCFCTVLHKEFRKPHHELRFHTTTQIENFEYFKLRRPRLGFNLMTWTQHQHVQPTRTVGPTVVLFTDLVFFTERLSHNHDVSQTIHFLIANIAEPTRQHWTTVQCTGAVRLRSSVQSRRHLVVNAITATALVTAPTFEDLQCAVS